MGGFVYIMAHRRRGATYIGVTNNLVRRVYEHRNSKGGGHTRSYNIGRLVWFEEHADIRDAIHMEKRLKKWEQAWKFELIENANPHWDDLWEEVAVSF